MSFHDTEKEVLKITCAKCGDEIDVPVRVELEIDAYMKIKED